MRLNIGFAFFYRDTVNDLDPSVYIKFGRKG